ncbi:CMP-N-acetylneuraminate-poly-alpha-2,8-sialyltransferase-like isoform X2 [Amphiura filiformis]|uniref:CMP-N-acetylneuraminate-poly-alpha-2, 8-sialyltransferase-like isoform X2 n=1 Tax=Amphiura filiformis TaxID=82378 RepID=UPI003B2145DF
MPVRVANLKAEKMASSKVFVFAILCLCVCGVCWILNGRYMQSTTTNVRKNLHSKVTASREHVQISWNITALRDERSRLLEILPVRRSLRAFFKKGKKDNYSDLTKMRSVNLCNCSTDLSFGILTRQFNTCAVVGNGGILKNSRCGKEIDSMDFVLRFNMAALKGYTDDVGFNTTIMSINTEGIGWMIGNLTNGTDLLRKAEMQENLYCLPANSILWYMKHTKTSRGYLRAMYDILHRTKHKKGPRLAFAAADLVVPTEKIWNISRPTSGLIGLTFATAICNRISLYGFYPFYKDESNKSLYNHYYDTAQFNFTSDSVHAYNYEYSLLSELNRTGAIRLVTSPCRYVNKNDDLLEQNR